MQQQPFSFDQELVLHLDKSSKHSVVVNHPFCVANDSRDLVNLVWHIKRTVASATSVNFVCLLENKTFLQTNEANHIPINRFLLASAARNAFHSNWMPAIHFGQDCCSAPNCNILVETQVAQTTSDVALSQSLCCQQKLTEEASDPKFNIDHRLTVKFCSIICQSTLDLNYGDLVKQLMACARAGSTNAGTAQNRFKSMLLGQIQDEGLLANLTEMYQVFHCGRGNPQASNTLIEQVKDVDEVLAAWVAMYAKDKTWF